MYAIWLDTFTGQVGSISGQYTILHYICYIVSIESQYPCTKIAAEGADGMLQLFTRQQDLKST